jgi:hypothetical protein
MQRTLEFDQEDLATAALRPIVSPGTFFWPLAVVLAMIVLEARLPSCSSSSTASA